MFEFFNTDGCVYEFQPKSDAVLFMYVENGLILLYWCDVPFMRLPADARHALMQWVCPD